ncbi:coatomer subunit alpha-1-like [Histomonas meleagridis]|uniref:coatomer subunit alpha-1-like n=1 Tax=Histomonas meleagridis TaxID=135588 RepID=UPI00355A775F|nr:coatomer subunit alpha-1-like [Histomonas meleagridis]KAH0800702.1 coatomer subunit alpha-1-like [Histomonas meleagridis]
MGHPEIALQLIDNPSDKFRFALDAGDLDEAFRIAETLNDPNAWEALADKSMLCGNFAQAEQAIKRSGNAERLAFFYLISGCGKKLKSMDCNNFLSLQRSIWMNDRESIFHLTKDILPLVAFIAADKEELRLQITKLSNTNIPNKFGCKADLTNPIADEGSCEDWPHLNIPIHKINDEDKGDNKWEEEAEIDESNVWGEDDLEIDEKEIENTFVPPLIGESEQQKFALRSHVPADAVAAGLFGEALNELHEQIALINAEPLKRIFIQSYISSNAALPSCACSPLLVVPLLAHETFPNTNHIKETVKTGKVLFRTGKFQESIESFRTAIQSIPLLVCSSNSELDEIYSLIEKCKNYIIGLTLEIARKQETNPARQLELASYFTHCKLDSSHLRLTLQSAMGLAFREKYYGQARTFASRLLELSPSQRTAEQARKVIQASKVAEKEQPQKPPKIEYEYRKPFVVCSKSLKPIYGGEERISCPFCGAFFKTEYKGLVCNICDLSQIGAKTNGLELIRKSN